MKHLNAKTTKQAGMVTGCLFAILIYLVACAVSWIITCGVIKLITVCFGWTFTWGMATGVWLVMFLIKEVFNMGEIRVKK